MRSMQKSLIILGAILLFFLTACQITQEFTSGAAPVATKCADSDGGKIYFVQGVTTYGSESETDSCSSSSLLIEYFCHPKRIRSEIKDCSDLGAYVCLNGACVTSGTYCGDNSCDSNEDCSSCPADCGTCPPAVGYCGDKSCDTILGEDCNTCPGDCGSCPPTGYCGDLNCDPNLNEDCNTCSADCGQCPSGPSTADVAVQNKVLGNTTKFIGVNEGGKFRINELADSKANTYRKFYGMDEFLNTWLRGDEYVDLKPPYGSPGIDEIKAVLNDKSKLEELININGIDQRANQDMFCQDPDKPVGCGMNGGGKYGLKKQLDELKARGINPVITVRNKNKDGRPGGAPPKDNTYPFNDADWNEYWHYVFGLAYWANVYEKTGKPKYGITRWQVHNEPSIDMKGATKEDYVKMVDVTYDAVKTANDLAGAETHLTSADDIAKDRGLEWLAASISGEEAYGYKVAYADYHNYADYHKQDDLTAANRIFQTVKNTGKVKPMMLSEWGTFTGNYNNFDMALRVASTIFALSQLQKDAPEKYLEMSHIFTFVDWGGYSGLVQAGGTKKETYWAFRLENRCLQGGRNFYELQSSDQWLKDGVIVTREGTTVYVNSVNLGRTFTIDLSSLGKTNEQATVYEYSSAYKDAVKETKSLNNGVLQLTVPSQGAECAVVG